MTVVGFIVSLSSGDYKRSSYRIISSLICSLYVGVYNWFRAAESDVGGPDASKEGEFLDEKL